MGFVSWGGSTFAATVQVEIKGKVTATAAYDQFGIPFALGADVILEGDTFSYRLVFNETNKPDDKFGNYNHAISAFSGHAGSFRFAGRSGSAQTWRSDITGHTFQTSHDSNLYGTNILNRNDFIGTSGLVGGLPLSDIGFASASHHSLDPSSDDFLTNPGALTRDKLPLGFPPGFGDFRMHFLKLEGEGGVSFEVFGYPQDIAVSVLATPTIPVPGAIWLFGSASLALLGLARRANLH